jgi:hypothetical protein
MWGWGRCELNINKITVIKTIKKELFLCIFGILGMLIMGIIFNNIFIVIIPILFYLVITITKLFYSNDFYILKNGFAIIGINKKMFYNNDEIKNIDLKIHGRAMSYRLFIDRKMYYINISDENKKSLIEYFSNSKFNGKELYIEKIRQKNCIL